MSALHRLCFRWGLIVVLALLGMTPPAHAANRTSAQVVGNWTVGTSWIGGVAPANDLTSDWGIINNTSTITVDAVRSVGGVFVGSGTGTATWNINNNLTIGALNWWNGVSFFVGDTACAALVSQAPGVTVSCGGKMSIAPNNGTVSTTYTLGTGATLNANNGLWIGNNSGGSSGGVGALTVNGGTVNVTANQLWMGRAGTGSATLTLNSGSMLSTLAFSGFAGTATLNLNGGTIQIRTGGGGASFLPAGAIMNVQNGGVTFDNNGVAGTVVGALLNSGTGGLTKIGAGTLTLSGANTYAGGTTISAGTALAANASAFGTGTITLNGGTLDMSTYSFANAVTLNNTDNTIWVNGAYRTLSGKLTGAGGFTLGGINTPGLNLTNPANDFAGNITVNSGTYLQVGTTTVGEVIPDTCTVTVNGHLRLEQNTGVETLAGLSGNGLVWRPTGSSGTYDLRVGSAASSTFDGAIGWAIQNNNLKLTKIGAGTLTLTGANLYTDTTTISGGTLQIGNGGTTGQPGTGAIVNNAALVVNRSNPITVGNAISGTGTLTKEGGGTLTLTANNGYAGATTVNGGTLAFSGSGTIPAANAIAVNNGGTLTFARNDTWGNDYTLTSAAITVNRGGTLSPGGFFNSLWNPTLNDGTVLLNGGLNATYPAFQFAGTLTATGTASIVVGSGNLNIINIGGQGNGTLTVNTPNGTDDVTNNAPFQTTQRATGALTKAGPGKFTLTATNTYVGATTISGGTLAIGGAGLLGNGTYAGNILNSASFVYDSSANQTLSGTLSGAGTVTKSSTGTLILSLANTYTGLTTINGGTITLSGGADRIKNSNSVAFGGGTLDLGANNQTLLGLSVNTGGGNVTGSGTLTITGAGGVTANDSATISAPISITTADQNWTVASGKTLAINNNFTFTSRTVYFQGAGVTTLNGTTYSGASFRANASGTVTINSGNLTAASHVLAGSTTAGAINWNSTGTLTPGSTLYVGYSGGQGTFTQTAGTVYNGTANGLEFANSSTYNLNGGTLSMGARGFNSFNLGNPATVCTLNFGGGTLQATATWAYSAGANLVYGIGAGKTAYIDTPGSSITLNGVISGASAAGLTKSGSGTLTLGGASIHTGLTTVSGGKLVANYTGVANQGITVPSGGGVTVAQDATLEAALPNAIYGWKSGAAWTAPTTNMGLMNLTGAGNVNMGPIVLAGGEMRATGAGDTYGTWNLNNDVLVTSNSTISAANVNPGGNVLGAGGQRTFTVNSDATLTFSGFIRNGGNNGGLSMGIIKAGEGAMVLSGANTFTATTTINAGTLQIGDGGTSGQLAGGPIVDNALLVINRGDALSMANVISGTGTVTKTGGGALTLSATTSSLSGDMNIVQGSVVAGAGHNDTLPGSVLGAVNVTRNVNVGPGATLSFSASDVFGNNHAYPQFTLAVTGGTVTNNGSAFVTLGPIVLNGASMAGGGLSAAYQVYCLNGAVRVIGSAPSTMSSSGANAGYHLAPSTTFDVSNVTSDAAVDLTVSAPVLNQPGAHGNGSLTKTGAGTMLLGNANTYSGGTTLSAGTAKAGNASAFGTGAITLDGGTLDMSTYDLANPTIVLNTTSNTILVDGNYRLLSGRLTGAGGFTADGINVAGLTLSNPANDFAGNVTINADVRLLASVSEVLPDTAVVTVNANGNLRFDANNGVETIAGLSGTGNGLVWRPLSSSGTFNLRVGAGGTTSSFPGSIGVSGQNSAITVTKIGGGTLTLSGGTSRFTGDLIVSQGIVIASGTTGGTNPSQGSLGNPQTARAIQVASGATLQLAANDILGNALSTPNTTFSIAGLVENTGVINVLRNPTLAGGELRANGGSSASYPAYMLRGTVSVTGGAPSQITATGSVNGNTQIHIGDNAVGGVTTFDVADVTGSAAADLTVSAAFQNSRNSGGSAVASGLTKAGAGTMLLAGINTYSSATTVSAGTLLVNGAHTTGSGYNVNSGVLGGTGTIGGAGTVAIGAGATLTAGDTNSTGTLRINAPVSLQAGSTLVVNIEAGGYDQIDMSGGAGTFTPGDANLQIVVTPTGYRPAEGTEFVIVSGFTGALSSTFHNLAEGAVITIGRSFYQVHYDNVGHRIVLRAAPFPSFFSFQ